MKVLIVVTSHDQLGNTGTKTGWYLPEVAHPYNIFRKAGYDVDFVSPKGGKAPMDPGSVNEEQECKDFLANESVMSLLNNTKKPSDVKPGDYGVIFYAGGHGPMYDLPDCAAIETIGAKIYENNGIVGAVCHGTVGLIPIKLKNGENILKGQTVTSFTNAEEKAVGLMEAMPFALETKLKESGANFVGVENFQANTQVSGRIITGQNPASARGTAEAIVKQLS